MLKLSGPLASIPGLCLSDPPAATIERIQAQLPNSIEDWERWLQCVQQNRVETQTLTSLSKLRLATPRWVNASLEERSQVIRLQNRIRRENFIKLLTSLKEHQIPVILLKANAIAREIYSDYDYKPMVKVMLLYKPEFLSDVKKIYQEQGYATHTNKSEEKVFLSEKFGMRWPWYFNRDKTLQLGTCWNITQPFSSITINANDLWERSEKLIYEGLEVQRLSKEDFIHHLCIDLSPYDVGAKELSDIFNCFTKWKNFNWNLFRDIVTKAKSFESVYRALTLSQSLFFIGPVQDFLDSIQKHVSPKVLYELEKHTEHPENILLFRTTYFSQLREVFESFSSTEKPLKKLHLISQLGKMTLWPPLRDAAHMNFQNEPSSFAETLWCRIKAPLIIADVFVKDLGWSFSMRHWIHSSHEKIKGRDSRSA